MLLPRNLFSTMKEHLMKTLFASVMLLLANGASVAADTPAAPDQAATAIFAGGCFWCTEADFEKLPGVIEAESGYTGGQVKDPGYEQVSAGKTGHTEAVRVRYDPAKVSYAQLVEHYWRTIDPTVKDRQFCDVGNQYRTGIYYQGAAQREAALASKAQLEKQGRFKQIYTEVVAAGPFYPAETYHQDYYKKNPVRYKFYRLNCGRDARLAEVWGKAN
jgi:peptide-methionine (S)-S-oxide reductase